MPGYSAKKEKKKKRLHPLLKNACHSHFLQTDNHASLPFTQPINIQHACPFMRPINIFSRISAIPQPRSNSEAKQSDKFTSPVVLLCNLKNEIKFGMHDKTSMTKTASRARASDPFTIITPPLHFKFCCCCCIGQADHPEAPVQNLSIHPLQYTFHSLTHTSLHNEATFGCFT